MSDFPRLLHDAATKFKDESIAYAKVTYENNKTEVRLQALEIARQFVGDVMYGLDPKGILFYDDKKVFETQHSEFRYHKYGSGDEVVTIEIDFYESDKQDPYARFVARTSPNQLPAIIDGQGDGQWGDFQTGSAQTTIIRNEGETQLKFFFPALGRTVHFETKSKTKISSWGILFFKNVENLRSCWDWRRVFAVADHDKIVFRPHGKRDQIIGLFIPAAPLDIGGDKFPLHATANWKHCTASMAEITSAEDVDEKGAGKKGNHIRRPRS